MTQTDSDLIIEARLNNTGLSRARFDSAVEAVAHSGAVQAQDFAAAKWGLGLRVKNSTERQIEDLFNRGKILRTHVMRPTWHFVTPENIRWMVELTGPHVKAFLAASNRKLELSEELLAKSNRLITSALQKSSNLTRPELKTVLSQKGIETDVQRLAHIIMRAELDGLVCSGPLRGRQFTYTLMADRAPKAKGFTVEEASSELAFRYFDSHGPAQMKDFAWWSGLTLKQARRAVDLLGTKLAQERYNGKIYWRNSLMQEKRSEIPPALLLSVYDEYTIAYKDRSDISAQNDMSRMISMGNALTAVIILDGRVAGSWKRTVSKGQIEIRLNPFRTFSEKEKEALAGEAAKYGAFHGVPAVLSG